VLGMIGSPKRRALTPWTSNDPSFSTYQASFSQEQLVSPLREKEGYFEPSKSMTYRRSRVFEQTGLMIGQQLDNTPPITKRDAQAAWKEQLTQDLAMKNSPVSLDRKPHTRRPFTPWLYDPDFTRTVGNSGLNETDFLARGAEVRERLRRDRSDVCIALASKKADMSLIDRRHIIMEPGGGNGGDTAEKWI
jgi:hypothetical protein